MERVDAAGADWSIATASGYWERNTSLISDDFPDPATPVTTVRTPLGMSTLTSFRLFTFACLIASAPEAVRNVVFTGVRAFRCFPVSVSDFRRAA